MTALLWLVPAALALGGIGLLAFLWSLRSGQFDDLEGAGWRALEDDDLSRTVVRPVTVLDRRERSAPKS